MATIDGIRTPFDYYAIDPSISAKVRLEVDKENMPCNIFPMYCAPSGKRLVTVVDFNALAVTQTLDARAIFGGVIYVQNNNAPVTLTLPTLVNFKTYAGQSIGTMTGLQRTAATVPGQNFPGDEEFYVQFQVRNATANAVTIAANGDGLIVASAASTAANSLVIAANSTKTYEIVANNIAGTGVAFFINYLA